MGIPAPSVLTQSLLDRCRDRAPRYDRDNCFFQDDFDDLKAAGYLKLAIPAELGGLGLTLAQVGRITRELAQYAPPTALALNMHNYWVGDAADAWRQGDKSVEWILREAAAGEIFAAGHAEHGNDIPGLLSTTRAERVDGGYRFHGRKAFGSLTPVWTRLGMHGMDTSDPSAPKIVHAFMPRDTTGFSVKDTWDVLGMRATRSDDTVLDGAFVPDKYIARVVPAGVAGVDHFIIGFFTWGLVGFANVYYGIGLRIRDVLVEQLKTKSSIALTRPMIYHPEIQHGIAEIVMDLEAIGPHVDAIAGDWSEGRVGPDWFMRLVAMKHKTVDAVFRIADRALDLSGGFGMFKKSELERLFRDARAGKFHPANPLLTHEIVGKIALGINPDEQPRWG
ncbi:MAG TPA: acyl-CoA dehydrogenase family protein [Vicinamibacterales bacterium]|jgi:alkylation response protein AidB-like acyl-CoA dehydrogenase|nr:acyl-CoA dehydrogenase family protein [Vicinamibacterales bacterium]